MPNQSQPQVVNKESKMIRVVSGFGITDGSMALGTSCRFEITAPSEVAVRISLHHRQVIHLRPLRDWSEASDIDVFPEAPGPYLLVVDWRHREESGSVELGFVVEPQTAVSQPVLARHGDFELWTPSQHEASLVEGYEMSLIKKLDELVLKDSVVYDIGANIGAYAMPLARCVGPMGRVYCFEPNPLCVAYLQANLERNGCSQCRILPLALTSGIQEVEFIVNFANSLLGISHSSEFFNSKIGQRIRVEGARLDQIQTRFKLPDPDVIKIDVEGAELDILPGILPVLERARPLILIEIHHPKIAEELLPILEGLGYRFKDGNSGEKHGSAVSLIEVFGMQVRQVICQPSSDLSLWWRRFKSRF